MDPQTADEEPNEFSVLDSTDLLAAFLHAKYGEDALREVFIRVEFYREPLEKAADVLAAKGLSRVADIVADIAAGCPSEIESNPYEEGPLNWSEWRRIWRRKRWVESGEMEKSLRVQSPRNGPRRH
jgi:hypothetical protein